MVFSKRFIHFISVVKFGSMVKASEILNITPSAVCQGINALEKQLGVKLLKKNCSGGVLTNDGIAFYNKIEKHFEAVNVILDEMFASSTNKNEIIIVCDGLSYPLFNKGFIDSMKKEKNSKISLRCELLPNVIESLKTDSVDVIISPIDIDILNNEVIKVDLPAETIGLVVHKKLISKYFNLNEMISKELFIHSLNFLKHDYFTEVVNQIKTFGYDFKTLPVGEMEFSSYIEGQLGFTFLTDRLFKCMFSKNRDLVFLSKPFKHVINRRAYFYQERKDIFYSKIKPFVIN
ncbi:LysR family transcriptional regulator [Cronobacter sakazakii]